MRRIDPTGRFKRDLKREMKGPHGQAIIVRLEELISLLAADEALPSSCRDHALTGDWKDHRDCHVRPDLVLIYRKPDEARLQLVRLGSHAELSL